MSNLIADDDVRLTAHLARVNEDEIAPEHRAWLDGQIRATLARKAGAGSDYRSMADVRAEFGL
jgi:hypothetical protein